MPTYVRNTNIPSLISQYQLGLATKQTQQSMERLSSGYKINKASDDAAGLAISNTLVSQITKMNRALSNAQDGISILQIADGSLQVIADSMQRIRELTVQAGNDSYSTAMRSSITGEIVSLSKDIDRIAASTQFNGMYLLNGTTTNAPLQIGPNSNAGSNVLNISQALSAANTGDVTPGGLALFSTTATFSSSANLIATGLNSNTARSFLDDIDRAISNISVQRGHVGAYQNQLENASQNLMSSIENVSAANSRIRDVDVAEETSKLAQSQVLQQASISILGQTNQIPQMILGLLQGRS